MSVISIQAAKMRKAFAPRLPLMNHDPLVFRLIFRSLANAEKGLLELTRLDL